MSNNEPVEAKAFISSFKGFLDQVVSQTPAQEPVFMRHLRTHFAADPTTLPILTEQFEKAEHPNLHLAVTEVLAQEGRSASLLGVIAANEYMGVKLSYLLGSQHGLQMTEGPVEYVNIALDDGRVMACVQSGLYLIRDKERPLALLVRGPREMTPYQSIDVEVMAPTHEEGEALLSELRTLMRLRNVYRSHMVSLGFNAMLSMEVKFQRLPSVRREDIILPAGVLERIERQTLHFSRVREKLLAAGRHLKRGLLLYGPPGTGKTLTAMYLAGQMPERTVILLTGINTIIMGRETTILERSCTMARLLQPATIILEDVDLVAEERDQPGRACGRNGLLFELLNQMDGIAEDADILFILTTNRPDVLEPALASRPGRIDQAIEIPLPDWHGRQRLFELYGQGLQLRLEHLAQYIERTEGVSAAFIRELLRKAALFAADEQGDIAIEDRHIEEALKELVYEGDALTKRLLGASEAFS